VSDREEPESYVHADVAVGEVLVPCACGVVAVGGALEPCRSTAVGAVGTLLTSPCFHRGLRTAVVMGVCGVPSLLVLPGRARWDIGLVPRSLS
jgi:tetrahydromethanopterin S-methyltransferase subunit D